MVLVNQLNCTKLDNKIFEKQDPLIDVYYLKPSEDFVENIISPVISDTNRSFKRYNALSLSK